MPFIPVPGVWEVLVKQHVGSHLVDNVYYIQNAVALTQVMADFVYDAVLDAYADSGLDSGNTTQWGVDEIVVTDLTTATAPQFVGAGAPIAGGSAAQPLPVQASSLIQWHTALRGRSFRGRTFLGGATEIDSDGQQVPAHVLVVTNFALELATNVSAISASTKLAVVSRFSGTELRAFPGGVVRRVPTPRASGVSTPITSWTVPTPWATQRRRTR